MIFSASSIQFLFCQAVSLLLQLEQPPAVRNPSLSGLISSFPVYFFTISEEKLWLQFLVSVLISSISGYLQFLGIQLSLEEASCTFQGHFWFSGSQLPSWLAFFLLVLSSRRILLFSYFHSLVRSLSQLLTSSSPQPWLALLAPWPTQPGSGHIMATPGTSIKLNYHSLERQTGLWLTNTSFSIS